MVLETASQQYGRAGTWTGCPTKRCVGPQKKRAQAVAELAVGGPAPGQCSLCEPGGRGAGCLHQTPPKRPMVGMDETSKQLVGETRLPLPSRRGHPQRYDD